MAAEIRANLAKSPNLRVTSLACGAAPEMQDVITQESGAAIRFTGIDIDYEALETVRRWADASTVPASVTRIQANLVYLAAGKQELDLEPQDLIYSMAAIGYLNDLFVIKLLDWIYDHLAPKGRVVLGNFHPSNPDKAFMDYVLDWHLIHRSEAEMNLLFAASKFRNVCSRFEYEGEGVIMFAEGIKEG